MVEPGTRGRDAEIAGPKPGDDSQGVAQHAPQHRSDITATLVADSVCMAAEHSTQSLDDETWPVSEVPIAVARPD